MSATLKSISEAISISVSTVSRVLNGKAKEYRISEKTVQLVKSEAGKQNFRPNQIASSLRTKKTNTIGLIIPDISNNYFAAISRAVELEAREHGYAIILSDSLGSVEKEKEILELMKSRNVDGMLVVPAGSESKHLKAENKETPIILLDRYLQGSGLPYVSSDNKAGSFEAVTELIRCGHQKIACLQGLKDSSTCTERLSGYLEALESGKIKVDKKLISGDDFTYEDGYKSTLKILTSSPGVTAIFAMGNLNALGAMEAIKEKKLKIGKDISLICFDDQPYFSHLSTPLSAVAQQTESIGREAVTLLCQTITDGKPDRKKILLKTNMIKRQSVTKIT